MPILRLNRPRGRAGSKDREWAGRCDLSTPEPQPEASQSLGAIQVEGASSLPDWVGEHFQRNQYKLLRILWDAGEVLISKVKKEIYGQSTGKEKALDKVKDRVNRKLAEIGQTYEVITRRSEVYVLRRVS